MPAEKVASRQVVLTQIAIDATAQSTAKRFIIFVEEACGVLIERLFIIVLVLKE
jgi:hypothetical protein